MIANFELALVRSFVQRHYDINLNYYTSSDNQGVFP